jgi:hypothetical protein
LLETDKIKSSQSCFNDKIRNSIYKTKYIWVWHCQIKSKL